MKHNFDNLRESGYKMQSIDYDYGRDDTFDLKLEFVDPNGDRIRFSISCTDFHKEVYLCHVDILG